MSMPTLVNPDAIALGLSSGDRILVPPHWEPGTKRGRIRTVEMVRYTSDDAKEGMCTIYLTGRAPIRCGIHDRFRQYR